MSHASMFYYTIQPKSHELPQIIHLRSWC